MVGNVWLYILLKQEPLLNLGEIQRAELGFSHESVKNRIVAGLFRHKPNIFPQCIMQQIIYFQTEIFLVFICSYFNYY